MSGHKADDVNTTAAQLDGAVKEVLMPGRMADEVANSISATDRGPIIDKITKDDAERLYNSVLKFASLPGCKELLMLQSGSTESRAYISLLLNVGNEIDPSYEQLYLSRMLYDIEQSPQAPPYDIRILMPRVRTTIATPTAIPTVVEERRLLYGHLMVRIRHAATNLTGEQRIILIGHSQHPHTTTMVVAYALHGLPTRPFHKVIRQFVFKQQSKSIMNWKKKRGIPPLHLIRIVPSNTIRSPNRRCNHTLSQCRDSNCPWKTISLVGIVMSNWATQLVTVSAFPPLTGACQGACQGDYRPDDQIIGPTISQWSKY
jgi:hypothetical protein